MATNTHAWNIYAKQLFPLGYGYPLWQPDPDPTAAREVDLADVGWLADGAFFQLFNAKTKDKTKQVHADVPEDFVPFDPPNLLISGPTKCTAIPPLCSQTIETFDASGSANADIGFVGFPSASAGGSFSFKCADNQGALLMFSPAAYSTKIRSKRHVINYMREHFKSWVEFSDKWGLDLKDDEILFVVGTTKTAHWGVAALQGNYKEKEGQIFVELGSAAGLNMSVNISNQSLPQTHRKVGPSRPISTTVLSSDVAGGDESSTSSEEPNDQCIFFQYYQMKRRMGFFPQVKAGAGPHKLPPPGPDQAEVAMLEGNVDEDDEFEDSIGVTEKSYNPVNDLLDYILESSDASVALASTFDLYALFQNQEFPLDVPTALASLKPQVEVDENNIGTVVIPTDSAEHRATVVEETVDVAGTVDQVNPLRVVDHTSSETMADPLHGSPNETHCNDDSDRDGNGSGERRPDVVDFDSVHESMEGELPINQIDHIPILEHQGVYIAATPVAYISGLRYKRRETVDYDKITPVDQIGPQNSSVEERRLPSSCKWVPHVHPEGSVYFQQENWFTNAWLYDEQNLRDIDTTLHLVSLELRRRGLAANRYEICLDIDSEDDDELENGGKLGCYYVCDKFTEEVFWFQEVHSSFFYDGLDVKILSREHLRHAEGIGYWDHIYMFPHGRSLTIEQLHVLRADITYHSFDKKSSKSSMAPYNKDDLKDLLDILKEIEALVKDGQKFHLQQEVAVTRPQHIVVVSRLRQAFCRERFMRLHGEHYAQLGSDRSVYENKHRERSLLFRILTWIFFFTPQIYFEHLSKIWVDKKINYDRWKSFIRDLQDGWMASITPSAVILTANVVFLAIQSVDANGSPTLDRSMGQIPSYMSTLFSISNIVACTALTWQHRRSEHHYPEHVVKYLVPRASSRRRIETLAIICSIPTMLFLFAILTFFIAISWVRFHASNASTRAIIAIAMSIIAVLLRVIAHNCKWQTVQDANSPAEYMARMKKRVKEARHRSVPWATKTAANS